MKSNTKILLPSFIDMKSTENDSGEIKSQVS